MKQCNEVVQCSWYTSKQFHSELKTDLRLERFPSGKFRTNELVLLLGMVAYLSAATAQAGNLIAGDWAGDSTKERYSLMWNAETFPAMEVVLSEPLSLV